MNRNVLIILFSILLLIFPLNVAYATADTIPGPDQSSEVIESVADLLAVTKGRVDEAYTEICAATDPGPSILLQNVCIAVEKVDRA